jgi:hypothetical protein
LKLREFFNFAAKQPRLKLHQMLPFYAFAGKLKNFQKRVAAKLHFLGAVSPLNALSAWNFEPFGRALGRSTAKPSRSARRFTRSTAMGRHIIGL